MSALTCPYCDCEMNDPEECNEQDRTYEKECPHCDKAFVFTVEYTRYYREHKADCLNGAPHDYQRTNTYPPEAARLRCSMCDDEKPLTFKP